MANFAVVQSAIGDNGAGATTVVATWAGATAVGSVLMAVVAYNIGAGTVTITPPTGWTHISGGNDAASTVNIDLYGASPDFAASQSGAQTWTLSAARKAVVVIGEISGRIATLNTGWNDINSAGGTQTRDNTATVGTTVVGGAATTLMMCEFVVTGMAAQNVVTFSAPSSGFSIVNQTSSSGGGGGATKVSGALLLGEVQGVGTTIQPTATISAAQNNVGLSYGNGPTPMMMGLLGTGF